MPQWLPAAEVESRGRRETIDPEIKERELRRAELGGPSERRGGTTAVPVRRVVVKRSTQRPTTRGGTVARIVGDGLRAAAKEAETLRITRRKEETKGGTGDGSLALDGACARVYLYVCVDKYAGANRGKRGYGKGVANAR
jgi:hypothetical protein